MSEKRAMRRALRALYAGDEARREESRLLCANILESPLYREARVIGGYVPMKHEADVTAVLEDAIASGRTLALPLCSRPPRMTLRRITSLAELVPGAYGIPEPKEDTEIIPVADIDLLLVPLEAIDARGMRLGKGGGYYDCLLAEADVPSLGCALSWQRVERVPAQPWDRQLTACADRDGVHAFFRL